MWQLGLPELFVTPPEGFFVPSAGPWTQFAVALAGALMKLGHALITVEHFNLPPVETEFQGRALQVWLTRPEPPPAWLGECLDPDVDTVIRVECSLWASPPGTNPQS